MAVKSKEMTASAMKVVIRKHLVCVSLTIKTGTRGSPGACCGKRGWGGGGGCDVLRGKPLAEGSDGRASSDLVVHTDSASSTHSSFLNHHESPLSQEPLEIPQWQGPAGPEAAVVQGKEPRLRVPDHQWL